MILNYKFNDKSYLYKTFVNFMLKNEKFYQNIQCYDKIIPVPVSKKREKERGYNQSLLIAKEISKRTGIKYEKDCLVKTKNIIEQSKLNREQRAENIRGAYELRNVNKIKQKKILLVDDIFTTGSTAKECCKTLKQTAVKDIDVLTIAKD